MNKDKQAQNIIDVGRQDQLVLRTPSGKTLTFARASEKDWERIKGLSNQELIAEWKSLNHTIEVVDCFSVSDLQIRSLMEVELVNRGFESEDDFEEDE